MLIGWVALRSAAVPSFDAIQKDRSFPRSVTFALEGEALREVSKKSSDEDDDDEKKKDD